MRYFELEIPTENRNIDKRELYKLFKGLDVLDFNSSEYVYYSNGISRIDVTMTKEAIHVEGDAGASSLSFLPAYVEKLEKDIINIVKKSN